MSRLLLLYCCFSLLTAAQAQKTTWSINVSPTLSHRIASVPVASSLASSVQSGERAIHAFDFGVDLRTQISHRLSLGSGLFYARKGFANAYVATIYNQAWLTPTYVIDFVQDYLDIPLFATYTLLHQHKLRWYALAGLNNSILLRERNEVTVRSGELRREEVPEETADLLDEPYLHAPGPYSLGLVGGWGVRAQVDDKTFVGLEATSKIMLSRLQDLVSGSSRRQYSLGLNFRFIRILR